MLNKSAGKAGKHNLKSSVISPNLTTKNIKHILKNNSQSNILSYLIRKNVMIQYYFLHKDLQI